ncbi:MAG TPA: baseplate J/gp47 family protein [Candidatus Limnocylindrales bacterium]
MAIYYLDVDDEITSAAARIRDSGDSRIALVLAVGSRVATSRINFRLLAGEAKHRNKRLAIIAADPSVQSVARSAELPVYASVGDYEKAEAALAGAVHSGPAVASGGGVEGALEELSRTVEPGKQPARGVVRGTSRVPAAAYGPAEPAIRIRIPWPLVAGLAFLMLIAIVTGMFFIYPSASVVLTLKGEPLGPMTVSVKVDPSVTAINYQAGTVPGSKKAFTVEASDTFQATGEKVVETAATGTVTFTNLNNGSAVTIPAGTQVSTNDGVKFATNASVTIAKASLVGLTIVPSAADVAVTASGKGLAGNVSANTIVNMPASLAGPLLQVTNKQPTTGGTHDVTPQVQQSDVDAAAIAIRSKLEASFKRAWQAPGATPSGSSLFAESAVLDLATCSQDPQSMVGEDAPSFQMDCQASGTVTTVSDTAVQDLVKLRFGASVKPGYALVDSSVTTKTAAGSVSGSEFVVPVTVQAIQVPVIDVAKIKSAIQGKSVEEARAYLLQFGDVEISVSPGWSSSIPGFDFRIDIEVVDPTATGSGVPRASGSGSQASSPATQQSDGASSSGAAQSLPIEPSASPSV